MKRILSIDGGGIRGSLTACILVALEQQVGQPCAKCLTWWRERLQER